MFISSTTDSDTNANTNTDKNTDDTDTDTYMALSMFQINQQRCARCKDTDVQQQAP